MFGVTLRSASSPDYKGRGGGGSSHDGSSSNRGSSGKSDGWPVPPVYKVELAVYIILGFAYIVQIGLIARYSGRVANMTPFILAALALLLLVGIQAMAAIKLRLNLDILVYYKLLRGIDFLYAIEMALRHAAFFLLIHQRGRLLQPSAQNRINVPIVALLWKRIVDWVLIAIAFLVYITYAAIATSVNFNRSISPQTRRAYGNAIRELDHVITAMVILLAINVIASSWGLYSASRRAKSTDLVIRKLLFTAGPAFFFFALQYAAFDIYSTKWSFTGTSARVIGVVQIIVDGICRLIVFAALISVMTLPIICVITPVYAPILTVEIEYPTQPYNPHAAYQPPAPALPAPGPTPGPTPAPSTPGAPQPWTIPNTPYQYNQQPYPQPQQYQPYPQQHQQQYSPPFTLPPNAQPPAFHAPPQHPPS